MNTREVRELKRGQKNSEILYVAWVDPQSDEDGWKEIEEACKLELAHIETVGFPIRWSPHLVLAQSYDGENEQVKDTLAVAWPLVVEACWLR